MPPPLLSLGSCRDEIAAILAAAIRRLADRSALPTNLADSSVSARNPLEVAPLPWLSGHVDSPVSESPQEERLS
jgi:hypothetical protein